MLKCSHRGRYGDIFQQINDFRIRQALRRTIIKRIPGCQSRRFELKRSNKDRDKESKRNSQQRIRLGLPSFWN